MGLFLGFVTPSYSVILETQGLGFGAFALRDNSSNHQIVIAPGGGITTDSEFVIIANGQPGSFDVSGFPDSTALILSAGNATLTSPLGGQPFSIVSPTFDPVAPVTDGLGNASFNLGATLQTSGTNGIYLDDNYSGTMTITVNF